MVLPALSVRSVKSMVCKCLTLSGILFTIIASANIGIIGLFSYMGAATQDWISGFLIDSSKVIVDGVAVYNFDMAFTFWIGASILSMILALSVWNVKPRE